MSAPGLEPFRERLDSLDEEIARLLGERFATCREIALYKREHAIPMMQPARVAEVRARYLARGAAASLPPDYTEALFELTIAATCKMEDELIDGPATTEPSTLADQAAAAPPPYSRRLSRSHAGAPERTRAG
ncbi:MAG TPA: chorismate mutase [Solirubrobacteraceae bacterium]|nr:chorismate mutase [Solirubrobacteraceae bacterium]